eukprot:6483070-Amphidinium_carterae.1
MSVFASETATSRLLCSPESYHLEHSNYQTNSLKILSGKVTVTETENTFLSFGAVVREAARAEGACMHASTRQMHELIPNSANA